MGIEKKKLKVNYRYDICKFFEGHTVMSDEEIKQYLIDHSYQVPAQDGILDIFNTSYQIIDKH